MSEVAPSNDGLRYIKVSDFQCFNLPDDTHRYFVSITVADTVDKTAKSTHTRSPTWREHFLFAVARQSSMTLTVFRSRKFRTKEVIGVVHIDIDQRLDSDVDQDAPLELVLPGSIDGGRQHVPEASIRCKITERSRSEIRDEVMSRVGGDVENMNRALAPVQAALGNHEGSGGVVDAAFEAASTWGSLLKNIGAFASLVVEISKIHPYVHAAWKVLSITPGVIKEQLETNDQLRNLVAAMERAHEFVHSAEPLEKVKMHEASFEKLAHATLECALLIREYVRTDNFAMRAVKNISGEAKKKLTAQIESLQALMNQFGQDATIHTELTVIRTLDPTELIKDGVDERTYLDDMPYAKGAGCVSEKRCLEGTRVRLLDSIRKYLHGGTAVEGQDSKRILLLTGAAGSGKSTIAHEIAHHFNTLHTLGASFCFTAPHSTGRSVYRFLSTITRDLAEFDSRWKDALLEVIKSDKDLRTTYSPQRQLEELILKPAQRVRLDGDIAVVIDALDEVADDERKPLLDCLSRLAMDTMFPDNIRFLITSRPEPDILSALNGKQVHHMVMLSTDTKDDIHSLIVHELLAAPLDIEEDTIRNEWVDCLVDQAGDSFQWAYTSCQFIKCDLPGLSVKERFLMLKQQEYRSLESLYEGIMTKITTVSNVWNEKPFVRELQQKVRRVLHLILAAYEPLPWSAWVDLLSMDEDMKAARSIIPLLGFLFRGVSVADRRKNLPMLPAHTSLRDYLTKGVEPSAAHLTLVNATLYTMEAQLRFNICGLETSYLPNKDVPELSHRIRQNISPALLYACRFWDSHLTAAPHEQLPFDALFVFLKQKLLFWMEVMSLIRNLGFASIGIKGVNKWIQTLDMNEQRRQLDKIFSEVDHFVSMCTPAISLSMPHLYLSALSYVPPASYIYRHYSDVYTGGAHMINKEDIQWPECILHTVTSSIDGVVVSPDDRILATAHYDRMVRLWNAATGEQVGKSLAGHTDSVISVAFSPNGKIIASGSADSTVRLWNITTRKQIGDALRGHTGRVLSVTFSPNGQTLASGSTDKTVRLWKVADGEPASEPLTSHTDWVMSVTFSPQGTHFASASRDRTVRVWTAETREPTYAPLKGHAECVSSIQFSPDGRTLASGADDNTIQLWDVATGKPKGSPFVGHTDSVTSVAFSPDGRTLASGSGDNTIRLWMVDTGRPVGKLLRGHVKGITSVAFLKDGQTLISGAYDHTIRVWKIQTVHADHGLVTGHSGPVYAAAFSLDNKSAVSASGDGTVRVWDIRTGQPTREPLQNHIDPVSSVVFSPDGTTIASGSRDHTIRLWDPQTGQLAREPLVGHSDDVNSVAFSPDSKIIASGSSDKTIRLWSAVTGKPLADPLTGHTSYVISVAFSPDGRCLASGSLDKTIMLWNVATGQRIGEPLGGHEDYVRAVAFSPDRKTIASGSDDATIRLWHVDTRESIGEPLKGHTRSVTSVAFSWDGKTLVSGADDHTIRVWDVATHAAIGGPLRGHTARVTSVAFSTDCMTILSGSYDCTVRLWSSPVLDPAPPARLSSHGTPPLLPTLLSSEAATADGDTSAPATGPMHNSVPSPDISAGSPPIEYTNSSEMDEDTGYILGPNRELLFWVPPEYRTGLWRPSTRWVTGTRSLHLDLSHFVHGEHWGECWDQNAT
ncbi:WD40 repeat-like protein [Trametopsis cervina]|nr:WD40 repeat-like protein [Trametopsis cervina]